MSTTLRTKEQFEFGQNFLIKQYSFAIYLYICMLVSIKLQDFVCVHASCLCGILWLSSVLFFLWYINVCGCHAVKVPAAPTKK